MNLPAEPLSPAAMKNIATTPQFLAWAKGLGLRVRTPDTGRHSRGAQSARVNAFYAKPAGSKIRRRMAASTLGSVSRGY